MPVKGKAKKKCKHEWVWLDCGEGLICIQPDCHAYSKNINDAPFGESKLLYMEMDSHNQRVKKLNISISRLQIWCGIGWAFSLISIIYAAALHLAMEIS